MDQSSSSNATTSTSCTPGNFSAYIGNLRSDITVDELKDKLHSLFADVGVPVLVTDIQVFRNSWKKPTFGFVVLGDKSTFDSAVEKLNGIKNDEIVFTGKEFVISSARRQAPQLSQPHTTTEIVVKSVRKNSKKGKRKATNNHNHKNKIVRPQVVMATSTISDGDTHTLSRNGQVCSNVPSSSQMKNEPSSSGMNSFIPSGKYFYVGQKLGTEDRLTEYKQGGGRYLDYQFKCDVGKYVCAFLNSEGGTLLIGVKDDCTVCGTEIPNSKREDQLRLQLDKIMKGFNPNVFPNLYSVKFIPVYPLSMMTKNTDAFTGSCSSSIPGDGNPIQLPETMSDKALQNDDSVVTEDGNLLSQPPLNLRSPPVPRKLPPLNLATQESNTSGFSNNLNNTDSLSTNNVTPVKTFVQDKSAGSSTLNDNTLKVIEISVQAPPRPSGGQHTLYQNHKREVYIRLDGSVQGPLLASEIVEWGRCNMAESLHMEHDYLKQQVHRKQEEITMNLKLVDDLVKQKQFLEDQYKDKENTLVSEIDKLRTREKEIKGELEQVKRTKSKSNFHVAMVREQSLSTVFGLASSTIATDLLQVFYTTKANSLEHLDSMIMPISHDHVTILCHRKACRELELSFLVPLTTELSKESPVCLKHLNPMILEICDENESLGIDRDTRRSIESPVTTPLGTKIPLEVSLSVEFHNAVVSCVGY